MRLYVVESPTKVSKIQRILDRFEPGAWKVIATVGHWRGLPAMDGQPFAEVVDRRNGFAERFVVYEHRRAVEMALREAIETASELYIATDDDREGEAIAWHVIEHFDVRGARRVRCREITPRGVISGVRNCTALDVDLVEAQRARVVVDYLIGMEVSRLLWRFGCRSAGRLQSCALRIVVEREAAREEFVSREYWTLHFGYGGGLRASLGEIEEPANRDCGDEDEHCGPRIIARRFETRAEAERALSELRAAPHVVELVDSNEISRASPPPFTTATLLCSASSRLGFSSETTSALAQSLFERGLITFARTDSTTLADSAITDIRSYLGSLHPDLLPDEPVVVRKSTGARTAHEAIRPVSMTRAPNAELTDDEAALYDLIFVRTLCSQAKAEVLASTTVAIRTGEHRWRLVATGRRVRFIGWTSLDPEAASFDAPLPPLEVGQRLDVESSECEADHTKPPPRFDEAALIRYLERRGIGRPSTYVDVLSKLRDRGYVSSENAELMPAELGIVANDLLTLGFDELCREDFTSSTEHALDVVATGELGRIEFLDAFLGKFERLRAAAVEVFDRFGAAHPDLDRDAVVEHDAPCRECGSVMHVRQGKSGRYARCLASACGRVVSLEPAQYAPRPCPSCGAAVRILEYTKEAKRRRLFVCDASCGWKSAYEPPTVAEATCPKCRGKMAERRGARGVFLGCLRYPQCDGARSHGGPRETGRARQVDQKRGRS